MSIDLVASRFGERPAMRRDAEFKAIDGDRLRHRHHGVIRCGLNPM